MTIKTESVNIGEKFNLFSDYWRPRIVAEFNDNYVKIVRVKGEFIWHKHEDEDELFLVLEGRLTIKLRERDLSLGPGELVVIPKGIEHMPVAEDEARLMLIEPKTTLNTGNVRSDRTVPLEWI